MQYKKFAPIREHISGYLEHRFGYSASDADWQCAMESAVGKLEELDNLGKNINDLNIQDRVHQLFGMIFIAARV